MTDGIAGDAAETIRILHVDDDPDFAEMAAIFLERADERFVVETATNVQTGLDCLAAADIDCVVSDYDMPGMNGIEFLETVREDHPRLPFILFTGKGSESVASEAISAGVTDYLQKGANTEQYEVLANRISNVVDAHRSRRLLAERTRRLETLISNLPGIVYRCRNESGWPMEVVEGEIEAITGYAAEQLERGDVSWGDDLIHEADRMEIWDAVQDTLDADDAFEVTYRIVTADGETKWMWERGRVVSRSDGDWEVLEGFITDITERKERERELERRTEELEELTAELEAQYRYLFEEAPVMAVVTRAENRLPVIDDCNQRFAETLEYEREELVDRELGDFYTPESERRLIECGGYERALNGEFMREDRELVTADGDVVETRLRAVPRRDARDDIVGTLALYLDVRRRKELERQKERLEEFASIVSHDLRNPLNVAQSRVKLAQRDDDCSHLDVAIRAHDRMEALIEDLLTLARGGDALDDVESVDLADLVDRCWANIETAGATLVVDTDRRMWADRSRLRQLVENLLRNSVEHGSTSSRTKSDDSAEHGMDDDESTVTVSVGALDDGFYVADDGPGIPPNERDVVFDAGYSTERDGTGFGLRIVEQVAEAHGWTVGVTDSDAGGARFEVRGVEFDDDDSTA
ncbi:hybrid sensor histidine kinase/response regulator [Haloplanus aerogenes]|uniref:histidine kinase n=1 Tax=Haloplanus aerogenes TaxID=660522 RepID=A0A3M0CYI1_9EURY|nr:response regulator [Haloplanus aerogenes]AZH27045.1 response regulator [Haloplanus aerogenes]RMB13460.1 PAS domain S-box-containing protein [Haloplanus aerogenes]